MEAVEKKGVQNVKEALMVVVDMVHIAKDGKVNAEDLPKAMELVNDLGPALADMNQIPAEIKDLDPTEVAELTAAVVAKYGVTDAKAVSIIGEALKVVAAVYGLVQAIKAPTPAPAA